MKVLIAEDDPTSRLLLESVLKQWGYDVVSTCDGNEAWAAFQADEAPRLAILDWMMPGMDGVEVCRKVRQQDTQNPTYIIILTTLDRKADIVKGLESGADDYVAKPFHQEELRARVQVGRRVVELQSALADRVEELQEALSQIKTLEGLIPICMYCHKIRDDRELWHRMEVYIQARSEAKFSHGLCPECLEKYYPECVEEEDETEEA